MTNSPTITKIAAALVKAQSAMSNAKKGAENPFLETHYADLNAIRAACIPHLNANGITVLQPPAVIDGIDYVETVFLHESGEYLSSLIRIVIDKTGNAQRHGSGLSYARRYALQSMICIGAEDDDAQKAVTPPPPVKEEVAQKWFASEKQWQDAHDLIKSSTLDVNGQITADNSLTNAKTLAAWNKIINRLKELQS